MGGLYLQEKRNMSAESLKEIMMTKNMSTSYTFAQNESISPRQLYRLYVFNLLGVGTLVLPNNLAKLGKYAFISIALEFSWHGYSCG